MTKKIMPIFLSGIALLELTGCSVKSKVQNSTSETTAPEIAVSEPIIQNQTEEVISENNTQPSEEYEYMDGFELYEDYASFLEVFQKEEPEAYFYQIPEDCEYKVRHITRCATNYAIHFEDTDGSCFMLEIDFPKTYPTIEAFYENFKSYIIVEDNKFNIETDRYLFEDYADGSVAMYGITGEKNIAFALVGGNADKNSDEHEVLKERYENLNL